MTASCANSLSANRASDQSNGAEAPTAHALGLLACTHCAAVWPRERSPYRCPRCHARWHAPDAHGLRLTWAYLFASVVLYIPANLLPIMSTGSILGRSSHTILGGVAELWSSGSWDLSLIVFVASIVVPILKILVLALLAWTAQRRSSWRCRERARLYRIVEAVGHWSMLDVYVVVLLVALVRFGNFASVQPGPGLVAFASVVVLTMLAASSFDPRLIWSSSRA
ncbi:MAG TPA: paraquat-inducible protein A [Burkholderiaceae bacterium]|nr:paraquat-inducible protein A [Burkholderiaceae bacterium]